MLDITKLTPQIIETAVENTHVQDWEILALFHSIYEGQQTSLKWLNALHLLEQIRPSVFETFCCETKGICEANLNDGLNVNPETDCFQDFFLQSTMSGSGCF